MMYAHCADYLQSRARNHACSACRYGLICTLLCSSAHCAERDLDLVYHAKRMRNYQAKINAHAAALRGSSQALAPSAHYIKYYIGPRMKLLAVQKGR